MHSKPIIGIAAALITLACAAPVNAASRLVINQGGTAENPRVYDGTGKTRR